MKKFFKQLFCKHSYEKIRTIGMINVGANKMIEVKCSKCGKITTEIV